MRWGELCRGGERCVGEGRAGRGEGCWLGTGKVDGCALMEDACAMFQTGADWRRMETNGDEWSRMQFRVRRESKRTRDVLSRREEKEGRESCAARWAVGPREDVVWYGEAGEDCTDPPAMCLWRRGEGLAVLAIGTPEPQQALGGGVAAGRGLGVGRFEVTRITKGKHSRRHAAWLQKQVPCTFRYPTAPTFIQPGVSASQKRRKRASDSPQTHLDSHRQRQSPSATAFGLPDISTNHAHRQVPPFIIRPPPPSRLPPPACRLPPAASLLTTPTETLLKLGSQGQPTMPLNARA